MTRKIINAVVAFAATVVIAPLVAFVAPIVAAWWIYHETDEEDAKYTDEPDKGHPVSDVHDALQYLVCGIKNSGMNFSNPYMVDGENDPDMDEALASAGGMGLCF